MASLLLSQHEFSFPVIVRLYPPHLCDCRGTTNRFSRPVTPTQNLQNQLMIPIPFLTESLKCCNNDTTDPPYPCSMILITIQVVTSSILPEPPKKQDSRYHKQEVLNTRRRATGPLPEIRLKHQPQSPESITDVCHVTLSTVPLSPTPLSSTFRSPSSTSLPPPPLPWFDF
jgi:hypothetical protein